MSDVVTIRELTLDRSVCNARHFYLLADETSRTGNTLSGLLLDAPYQRESVWTLEQRQGLMRSFLSQLPVPAVICNDRFAAGFEAPAGLDDWRTAVVDGRQRIETLLAWRENSLPLPVDWFQTEHVEETTDGLVTRSGLTPLAQRHVLSRMLLPLATAKVGTLREEAQMYVLLNAAGTAHTDADLEHARRLTS